jgi:hypothetical protein
MKTAGSILRIFYAEINSKIKALGTNLRWSDIAQFWCKCLSYRGLTGEASQVSARQWLP